MSRGGVHDGGPRTSRPRGVAGGGPPGRRRTGGAGADTGTGGVPQPIEPSPGDGGTPGRRSGPVGTSPQRPARRGRGVRRHPQPRNACGRVPDAGIGNGDRSGHQAPPAGGAGRGNGAAGGNATHGGAFPYRGVRDTGAGLPTPGWPHTPGILGGLPRVCRGRALTTAALGGRRADGHRSSGRGDLFAPRNSPGAVPGVGADRRLDPGAPGIPAPRHGLPPVAGRCPRYRHVRDAGEAAVGVTAGRTPGRPGPQPRTEPGTRGRPADPGAAARQPQPANRGCHPYQAGERGGGNFTPHDGTNRPGPARRSLPAPGGGGDACGGARIRPGRRGFRPRRRRRHGQRPDQGFRGARQGDRTGPGTGGPTGGRAARSG